MVACVQHTWQWPVAFMISAAGNRDEAPGDRPVLGGGMGVFLSLGGPMAILLGLQSLGRKDCYKRITDPRSRVWSDREVAGPHGLSESTCLGKHPARVSLPSLAPQATRGRKQLLEPSAAPGLRLWQRQLAPGIEGRPPGTPGLAL